MSKSPVKQTILLEGALAVTAALEAGVREVHVVYFDAADKGRASRQLRHLCEAKGVTIKRQSRGRLDDMAKGKTHGGVVAEVGERRALSLSDFDVSGTPWFAMLDGVEDPYNFGYALRTLYAAGCDGVIARERNWAQSGDGAATVARASAGASERIDLAVCESPLEAAQWAVNYKLKVVAATHEGETVRVFDADLTQGMVLMIGGEKRGLPRAILQGADVRVNVPYGRAFDAALPSVAAAAAIGFEIARQRQIVPSP